MARIPAHEIERTVSNSIQQNIVNILELDRIEDHGTIEHIKSNSVPSEEIVKNCVNRINVDQDLLEINVNIHEIRQTLQDYLKL
ncbi:MAG TPA: hypothetical protein PLK85_05935, partial [Alphaproteobacteria bacterium]|nr:hypothetical protein [Alphaproteobacteria bacterium]